MVFKLEYSRLGGVGLPITKNLMTAQGIVGRFIPYTGNGVPIKTDNNYPQTLSKIAADSPTHGAAIQKKALLTFGRGLNMDNLSPPLKVFFDALNDSSQSINDILKRISMDYPLYGGFALRIYWNAKKKIVGIKHEVFKNVRIGMPNTDGTIDYFIVSNNWEGKMPSELIYYEKINAFNPDKIEVGTVESSGKLKISEGTRANAQQLIYFSAYHHASEGWYPVPTYIQGIDAALAEVKIGVSMNAAINNGIGGATIITEDNDSIVAEDDVKAGVNALTMKLSGPTNSAAIVYIPSKLKINQLEAIKADVYVAVTPEIRQRIITANDIPAILLEYSQGGGFNNRAEEMKVAIEQFQATSIQGNQDDIVRVLNALREYLPGSGEEEDFEILKFLEDIEEEVETTETETDVNIDDNSSLTE